MVNSDTPASPRISIDGKTVLEPSYLQKSNGRTVLSPERIKQLTIKYLRETLENDEKCRTLTGEGGLSLLEGSNMKADEAQAILQSVTRWLLQGDHSPEILTGRTIEFLMQFPHRSVKLDLENLGGR